jgi:hypothetical protein
MWGLSANDQAQQQFAVWLSMDVFELDGATGLAIPASREPIFDRDHEALEPGASVGHEDAVEPLAGGY